MRMIIDIFYKLNKLIVLERLEFIEGFYIYKNNNLHIKITTILLRKN